MNQELIKTMEQKEMTIMNKFVISVVGLMRTLTRTRLTFITGKNVQCLQHVGNVNKSSKCLCWTSIWSKSVRTQRSIEIAISA